MPKITFMGAGSTIFAKNILGDVLLAPALQNCTIALYDIDPVRLEDSRLMLENLKSGLGVGNVRVSVHSGPDERRAALENADFVVNAIQVGGYRPSTISDFEIPAKYGLWQTIGDTLGIGGIFRALRTIPVLLEFVRDMKAVAPDALLLNYSNPMAMLMAAVLREGDIRAVGLCHSVQGCVSGLLQHAGLFDEVTDLQWKIAGINHQAWLLELRGTLQGAGRDLYPEVKRRLFAELDRVRAAGGRFVETAAIQRARDVWNPDAGEPEPGLDDPPLEDRKYRIAHDMVRLEIMRQFGYYPTESSEHLSEYVPWFIKKTAPQLLNEYNIPLNEYPRRCEKQIADWKQQREIILSNSELTHERSIEYGAGIINGIVTGQPYRFHGNVMNTGLIDNLPGKACVEVPCVAGSDGVVPGKVGALPEQCAALNRTNINVQILTVEAALRKSRDLAYQAAMLDPHAAAECTIDQIRGMCDELFEAHSSFLDF